MLVSLNGLFVGSVAGVIASRSSSIRTRRRQPRVTQSEVSAGDLPAVLPPTLLSRALGGLVTEVRLPISDLLVVVSHDSYALRSRCLRGALTKLSSCARFDALTETLDALTVVGYPQGNMALTRGADTKHRAGAQSEPVWSSGVGLSTRTEV